MLQYHTALKLHISAYCNYYVLFFYSYIQLLINCLRTHFTPSSSPKEFEWRPVVAQPEEGEPGSGGEEETPNPENTTPLEVADSPVLEV